MSILESLGLKIPNKLKPPLRIALRINERLMLTLPRKRVKLEEFKKMTPLKLNIGCGKVKFPGWVNIDIEPSANLIIDVTKGLPFDDNSVDFVYNEHFLEHLTFEKGEKVLKGFKRCLKKGGVLRIAMPDLDYIIQKYNTDWANQDWLSWPEYRFIKTRGQMMNVSLRWWEHEYLYNEEDLRNQLIKAGFQKIIRCEWNKSNNPELSDLERRKDSRLIMEAEE